MEIPNSSRNFLARAPAATLEAVSLALERSNTGLTSSKLYFITPGRSAWPARILVTL